MSIDYKEFSIAGVHWVTLRVLTGFASFKFFSFSSLLFYFILFICWLLWVFIAVSGLSLVAAGGSHSPVGVSWLLTAGSLGHADSVALWHVGSPWTKDWIHGSCTSSWIPNHWTTREVLSLSNAGTPGYCVDLKLYNPWAILFFLSVKKKIGRKLTYEVSWHKIKYL